MLKICRTKTAGKIFPLAAWMIILILFNCKKPSPHVVTDYTVTLTINDPVPQSINIIKGEELIWENEDIFTHIIKSGTPDNPNELFEIGPIDPDETASVQFDSLGSFPYFSTIAPERVHGIVIVVEDTVIIPEHRTLGLPE